MARWLPDHGFTACAGFRRGSGFGDFVIHTKEPWVVFTSGHITQIDIGTPRGTRPCVIEWGGFDSNDLSLSQNRANARRIVDCVNAFASIPDPAAYIAAVDAVVEALEEAERQLAYMDSRWPTGTAPPTLGRIERALTAFRAAKGDVA